MNDASSVKYLQPEKLARISSLEMIARLVVEGFITGLHKSPYHGFSVEFAEHRPYMPGDSIRNIDWKVYGRTSRFYVKRFEEETNLKAYIIVDASASMTYSSGGISKFRYGCYLAASLAYLLIHQKDAAGLAVFDTQIRKLLVPRATRSYLKTIEETLSQVKPGGDTDIAANLHLLADRMVRRGLVIVISDLMDDPEKVMMGLKHFRHRQHEVIVFQVLDPQERDLNFQGDIMFEDLESGERLSTQPWHIRKEYQNEISQFIERYRKACRERQIDHVLLDTRMPFEIALMEYLIKRTKMK